MKKIIIFIISILVVGIAAVILFFSLNKEETNLTKIKLAEVTIT